MTPMPLGLFVKKLQPKVGLGRYDILFAYFVVEAKSKKSVLGPAVYNLLRGITPKTKI